MALALLVAVATMLNADPIERNDSHWWRMVLAGASIGFVALLAAIPLLEAAVRSRARLGLRALMVVAVVLGWFNYYQFDRKVFDGLGDYTDITYYYVNSKYLPELGYFGLYPAMIVADAEGKNHHSKSIRQYRDLRDYELKPVAVAYEHGAQLKNDVFTPERWKQFSHDIEWFLSRKDTRDMERNFYVDHGYNPPPTWSVPGAALANLVPVENIKSIALIDVGLVAGMFTVVAWAFGADVMLLSMLFFLCTFSGRWPILGEALLRFDWLSMLVVGICLLYKRWWLLAGVCFAYAGLNRIFPMIFFFGWGIVFLRDLARERRVLPEHLRFGGGAAAMGGFLILAALIQFGPDTFKDSSRNLLMHNRSYSSHRVGLGDLLLFRGETTREEMAKFTYKTDEGKTIRGIQAKEFTIQDMQPALRATAVVALVFLSVVAFRTRKDAWELVPLAVLPFYCATNPQINYYNLRIVLFVLHGWGLLAGGRNRYFHAGGLMLLFGCEVATQSAFLQEVPGGGRVERYYVTCTTSVWLGVYLVGLIILLVKEAFADKNDGLTGPSEPQPAPEVGAGATA